MSNIQIKHDEAHEWARFRRGLITFFALVSVPTVWAPVGVILWRLAFHA